MPILSIFKQPKRKKSRRAYLIKALDDLVSKKVRERAGYRCQLCGSRSHLQTHHNTYENLGHELSRDLLVLCDKCHARNSVVLQTPPTCIPSNQSSKAWYPPGRAGDIIKALEIETDPDKTRILLAEKMRLDKGGA